MLMLNFGRLLLERFVQWNFTDGDTFLVGYTDDITAVVVA